MVYNLNDLQNAVISGEKFEFVFFWGHTPPKDGSINESCFSQWWICDFMVDGVKYCCAEQYMMAEKATLFHDDEILKAILAARHPKQIKEFGRNVKDFDPKIWDNKCYEIVKRGNIGKFVQNSVLCEYLKTTGKKILVEASPWDRIWGIGMEKSNPHAESPMMWSGKNLLGFALTQVRDNL